LTLQQARNAPRYEARASRSPKTAVDSFRIELSPQYRAPAASAQARVSPPDGTGTVRDHALPPSGDPTVPVPPNNFYAEEPPTRRRAHRLCGICPAAA